MNERRWIVIVLADDGTISDIFADGGMQIVIVPTPDKDTIFFHTNDEPEARSF